MKLQLATCLAGIHKQRGRSLSSSDIQVGPAIAVTIKYSNPATDKVLPWAAVLMRYAGGISIVNEQWYVCIEVGYRVGGVTLRLWLVFTVLFYRGFVSGVCSGSGLLAVCSSTYNRERNTQQAATGQTVCGSGQVVLQCVNKGLMCIVQQHCYVCLSELIVGMIISYRECF